MLVFVATFGTLTALRSSVYSASAFVTRYLQLVATDNITEALRMPGVTTAADQQSASDAAPSEALLRAGISAERPESVHVTSDIPNADGSHTVTVSYRIAGGPQTASFRVAPEPALIGILPRWRFLESPLATLEVTVHSGFRMTIGGETFDVRNAALSPDASADPTGRYLVAAPVELSMSYRSQLTEAPSTRVLVRPAATAKAHLLMLPTPTLLERVQSKLDGFLSECARQAVLQPSGCPFGIAIDDRVTGDPKWSVLSTPHVSLLPDSGAFLMPRSEGVAHVTVPTQRLFDGEAVIVDTDVDFSVGLTVTVHDDDSISIQLR